MTPSDPFAPGKAPRSASREGRIALLIEAARVLLEHGGEAGLFVGGSLQSWLTEPGSDLLRDHWRIVKRASRHTPQYLAALLIGDEGQADVNLSASGLDHDDTKDCDANE